uniref:Disease resistance protein At4g27190-like leucine-rich repeats domain-containing protein n=1 Tax=Aegilops tauschii TaxID=37682 RepID=M8CBQ7_AEGTA
MAIYRGAWKYAVIMGNLEILTGNQNSDKIFRTELLTFEGLIRFIMPKPEEIKIQAKNIDAAAGEMIGVLEGTSKGNVILVHGWHGFGASAALKVLAQRMKSSKSKFDRVIHVDCSVWKSMRALQKAVAEELELPPSVMAIFDWCDEEDDFSGIDEGSRGVIADMRSEIFRNLISSRFVVIFHNGSMKYIDLYESCGAPAISVLSNKVLWTWHGRFQSKYIDFEEREKMELHTDVVVNYSHDDCIRDEALLEEAKEIVAYMGISEPDMNHMIVEKCFQYACALGSRSPGFKWVNWENHASIYLVCDGIIQGQGDTSAWVIADALQRNMSMDWLRFRTDDDVLRRHLLHDRWDLRPDEVGIVLSEVTSFFAVPDTTYLVRTATLQNGIFQHSHSSKLRVLHLSHCRFSFESPPFLCCSQLRLLQLNNCRNIPSDKHPSHNEDMSCFQKLWVLHLRSTSWYRLLSAEMKNFMADLRELTVEEVKDWSISDLRGRGPSLVKVHVEEQGCYLPTKDHNLPDLSSASFLKTVILINCVHVEQVVPGMMPPSVESFTFLRDSYTHHDYPRISRISFRGCSQLKSILWQGDLEKLEELDLSGTAVKTLDLRELEINNIKSLILLGCEKLYAILWPPKNKRTKVLEVLHTSTIQSTSPGQASLEEKPQKPIAAMGSSSSPVATAKEQGIRRYASFDFKWYICTRDTRILRSLEPVKRYIEHSHVYMEMGSSPTTAATVGDGEAAQGIRSLRKPDNYLYARDLFCQSDLQAGADNEGAISWMWDCPASPTPRAQDLYLHIHDKQELTMLACFTCMIAHPSFASDAHNHKVHAGGGLNGAESRVLLHLDYCPRLIHALPLSESVDTLPHLDTLEIVCCGDLREVFALDTKQKQQRIIGCPKLRRIHLYELPSLQHISGSRMSAPNLETVKIRGCWSLRSLPAVSRNNEKLPSVDCEKDWWDNLEWDGVEANHHPSLYEHNHSSYYKAQQQRGTVLR